MPETDSPSRLIGYARVSTYGQTLDAQLEQLKAAGCARIFREKVTSAGADRREFLRMLAALAPGDVVTVTRNDRLARSTFDLFAIVKQIVEAGGQFCSLAEPWADTGTGTGRLMIAVLGLGGRGARPYQDAHGGRAQPGEGARAAYGPTAEADVTAADRGTAAAAGRGATLKELAKSYNAGRATISRLGV
jgi:hypothetical protein